MQVGLATASSHLVSEVDERWSLAEARECICAALASHDGAVRKETSEMVMIEALLAEAGVHATGDGVHATGAGVHATEAGERQPSAAPSTELDHPPASGLEGGETETVAVASAAAEDAEPLGALALVPAEMVAEPTETAAESTEIAGEPAELT